MTTWQDAPDASGLWWVRREDHRDDVLHVDVDPDGVWINRGGEGWCSIAEYPGAQWCRVATPERVEALESALREAALWVGVIPFGEERTAKMLAAKAHAADVLCGATVTGERGSR